MTKMVIVDATKTKAIRNLNSLLAIIAGECALCLAHICMMDPIEYVHKRRDDISKIESAIQESARRLSKQPFQRIPRHLRRRAGSHNSRRLPVRFRNVLTGGHSQARRGVRSDNRPKPSGGLKQLTTHRWHSKRCHMIEYFGWKIPLTSNEKRFKNSIKHACSSNSCFLYDMSFFSCHPIRPDHGLVQLDGIAMGSFSWVVVSHLGNRHAFIVLRLDDDRLLSLCHPSLDTRNIPWFEDRLDYGSFFLKGGGAKSMLERLSSNVLATCTNCTGTIVLAERSLAFSLWKGLIGMGAYFGALQEYKKVALEFKIPVYPYDFISTSSALSSICTSLNCSHNLCLTVALDRISALFSSNKPTILVYLSMTSSGRVSELATIYNDRDNLVGYVTRGDFSETLGRVCAFGVILCEHDHHLRPVCGEKFTCHNVNGTIVHSVLTDLILDQQ